MAQRHVLACLVVSGSLAKSEYKSPIVIEVTQCHLKLQHLAETRV